MIHWRQFYVSLNPHQDHNITYQPQYRWWHGDLLYLHGHTLSPHTLKPLVSYPLPSPY
jgi:hypothetical protein